MSAKQMTICMACLGTVGILAVLLLLLPRPAGNPEQTAPSRDTRTPSQVQVIAAPPELEPGPLAEEHEEDDEAGRERAPSDIANSENGTGSEAVQHSASSRSTAPGNPVRWNLPVLSWDPNVSVPYEPGPPEVAEEQSSLLARQLLQVTENHMIVSIVVHDAATRRRVDHADIEIVDSEGRLRVSAPVPDGNGEFLLRYGGVGKPISLLARARSGDRVGFAVFGVGFGSPPQSRGATFSRYLADRESGAWWFQLRIIVTSANYRETEGRVLQIVDGGGTPVQGAHAYHDSNVLGQSDSDGMMTIALPELPNGEQRSGPETAIYRNGRVPVFLTSDELKKDGITQVALCAEEHVVKFYLLVEPRHLPPAAVLGVPPSADAGHYWGMLDRGVFAPGDDPKRKMASVGWSIRNLAYLIQHNNSEELESAVGRPLNDKRLQRYNDWYARQWKYNERNGTWQVVVPHRGRFVIALAEKMLEGPRHRRLAMYPGLYIDATDPANPKIELIYPE